MELSENNNSCVKLIPARYRIMYYVRYNAPLLESWKGDIDDWYQNEKLYKHTNKRHCISSYIKSNAIFILIYVCIASSIAILYIYNITIYILILF